MSNYLNHPDVQRPWSEWSEGQTLHLAVAYSNPFRWRTRRILMNDFRRRATGWPNVKLYVGELAYGDRPFEVTGDRSAPFAENDIQLRTQTELWHKENLLNVIVSRFPADWKYGGYSDADLVFTRQDWALEAIHQLQHYDMVQLFSSYMDLSAKHEPLGPARSFAWNYHHQDVFAAAGAAKVGSPATGSSGYGPLRTGRYDTDLNVFPFGLDPGAPGGAWAWTRHAFDTIGGLLDINILGGGDSEMAHGLIGVIHELVTRLTSPRAENSSTRNHADAVLLWQERARKLQANIGYVEQFLAHHFHGSKQKRRYYERWKILRDHDYNPFTDISRDWQGIYQWTGDKPRLRDAVRRYFLERGEDDPNLYGPERPWV
ncbi:MAG: hypothetical protein ACREQT_06085 [Candidatus Binataceae bacterium]